MCIYIYIYIYRGGLSPRGGPSPRGGKGSPKAAIYNIYIYIYTHTRFNSCIVISLTNDGWLPSLSTRITEGQPQSVRTPNYQTSCKYNLSTVQKNVHTICPYYTNDNNNTYLPTYLPKAYQHNTEGQPQQNDRYIHTIYIVSLTKRRAAPKRPGTAATWSPATPARPAGRRSSDRVLVNRTMLGNRLIKGRC